MSALKRLLASGCVSMICAASTVLACGAPPTPPPPPPAPPVVCCMPVAIRCIQGPAGTAPIYRVLYRYFVRDGGPMYQSNPMVLLPGQICLCSIWRPLPLLQGGRLVKFSFGAVGADYCGEIPMNTPPYGGGPVGWREFGPSSPEANQVLQFNQIYASAAGIQPPTPESLLVLGFENPGATIAPDSFFDIFIEVELAPGADPHQLAAAPGPDMAAGLFLSQNGVVGAEPVAVGLPPVPLPQFAMNPGQSAFYKIRPYRWIGPLCVDRAICIGDLNGDGIVNAADLALLLGSWGPCP